MKLFVVVSLALLGAAMAMPMDPNDEVELVNPTNTNGNQNRNRGNGNGGVIIRGSTSGNGGGSFPGFIFGGNGPVIVIRTRGGKPSRGRPQEEEDDVITEDDVLPRETPEYDYEEEEQENERPHVNINPFGGGFPVFSIRTGSGSRDEVEEEEEEARPGAFPFGNNPIFNNFRPARRDPFNILQSVLGGNVPAVPAVPTVETANCDFLCKILKGFGLNNAGIADVERAIEEAKRRQQETQNEVEGSIEDAAAQAPVSDSTYTEEVLPDGSIVRVNKTVVSNDNGAGGSYFFQSTSVTSHSSSSDSQTNTRTNTQSSSNNDDQEDEVFEVEEGEEPATAAADDVVPDAPAVTDDEQAKPIKLVEILSRKRRQTWTQQAETSSPFTNDVRQSQLRYRPSSSGPQPPASLADDTRVNDIITENGRRGGLVRIDPNSEFIEYDEEGNVVAIEEGEPRRSEDEEDYVDVQAQQVGQLRVREEVGQMTLPWQQEQSGQLRHTWEPQQQSGRQELPPPVPSAPVWVPQQRPSARQEIPVPSVPTWIPQQQQQRPSARQEIPEQPQQQVWAGQQPQQLNSDPWAQQVVQEPIFANLG